MSEQEQLEQRFLAYVDDVVKELGHADRRQPATWYIRGLILPGERKSAEPMAARVRPDNISSAQQSMLHLTGKADWDDAAVIFNVARKLRPLILTADLPWWIVDDVTVLKKGTHSVGVARQHSQRSGKVESCQSAVCVSMASEHGSIPTGYRLYLPELEWAHNAQRRLAAGVPAEVVFQTKGAIARDLISEAVAQGLAEAQPGHQARGVALMGPAYGDEADLRDWLSTQWLLYVAAVSGSTAVWWDDHPIPPPAAGHRRARDESDKPLSAAQVARALPDTKWTTVGWREGADGRSSRFARVRVRAALGDKHRDPEWLLIEWPEGQQRPARFWLSTLPERTSLQELVRNATGAWRSERDHQELRSELGLHQYEGRGWRGFHHHATLCFAAYGFLLQERLGSKSQGRPQLRGPAVPESFRPRGSAGQR